MFGQKNKILPAPFSALLGNSSLAENSQTPTSDSLEMVPGQAAADVWFESSVQGSCLAHQDTRLGGRRQEVGSQRAKSGVACASAFCPQVPGSQPLSAEIWESSGRSLETVLGPLCQVI